MNTRASLISEQGRSGGRNPVGTTLRAGPVLFAYLGWWMRSSIGNILPGRFGNGLEGHPYRVWSRCAALLLAFCSVAPAQVPQVAPARVESLTSRVSFDQNLGVTVPLDAVFRDETGRPVSLGYLLDGKRPAVLVMGYKECPMLCSMVLGGVTESLTQMRATTGQDFDVIDVSIDPHQSWQDAAAQKRLYYKRYARPGADVGWHFLTSADDATIHRLTDAVGFHYAYDETIKQYAHASGLVVLTPEGKVARYFFGVNFEAADLQNALKAAGTRQVSLSPIAKLLLVCFHYNPATSAHGALIMNGLRAAGGLTVVVLFGGLALLLRGEHRQRTAAALPAPNLPSPPVPHEHINA